MIDKNKKTVDMSVKDTDSTRTDARITVEWVDKGMLHTNVVDCDINNSMIAFWRLYVEIVGDDSDVGTHIVAYDDTTFADTVITTDMFVADICLILAHIIKRDNDQNTIMAADQDGNHI